MAASQGVSRGFHRLGLFLADIIVLVGGYYWVVSASEVANQTGATIRLLCVHTIFGIGTRSDFGISV